MSITWLQGPEAVDQQVWEDYLLSVRNRLVGSWEHAKDAYLTLKTVRESFGLPFIVSTEAGPTGAPDAWSPDLERVMINTQGFVEFLTTWADEAIAGKRRMVYDPDQKELVLELLDSDTYKITAEGDLVKLVDAKTGSEVEIKGTIGALPALAVVAIAAVASVAVYFTVAKICDTIATSAEQKTMRTLGDQQAKLIASGKATPEEAAKMTQAVYSGAKELAVAKGTAAAQEGSTGTQSTVRTVAWVALGITGIFLLAKVLPPLLEGSSHRRLAA